MTVKIDIDGLPRVAGALVVEEQGEGFYAVLLPDDDRVLITNDTGRRVLDLCNGSRSATEIVETVCATYPGVDGDKVRDEVHNFLQTASTKGVVTW